jgi:acetoin utilization deacetylase AcuC-like enzyme
LGGGVGLLRAAARAEAVREPVEVARIDLLSHADYARLHPTGGHVESQARIEALHARFPDFAPVTRRATDEDVLRVHTTTHLATIRGIDHTTWLDADTLADETALEAALLAAGGAIQAVERGGFALVRPPGHHALSDRAMGFCLFNNVAVAARWAQAELEIERVAIVDYDVHHGNGTQAIFGGDPSVCFVSLHQWPFYPGTGGPHEGDETTLNVPLPAGCGDAEYEDAFARRVEPFVERFRPDLVLVSAGFDAHEDDPLGAQRITYAGFRELSRRCAALAPRVAAVLEGGYNTETLPDCVASALDGFTA